MMSRRYFFEAGSDFTKRRPALTLPFLSLALLFFLPSLVSAQMKVETGTYAGNGSGSRSITVGFKPDLVILKGNNNEFTVVSTSTMPGYVKELGKNTALMSGVIQSLDATGFTVTADPHVNTSGVSYYWTAFSAYAGEMKVGTYLGTGLDNISITGVGFQPSYVIVMSNSGQDAMQRFPSQAGDASRTFQDNDDKSDRIQAFEPNGFQIGKHNTVNELAKTFHYVAFKGISGRVGGDIYLGDGMDNRNVTGSGFRPEYLLVSRRLNGSPTVQRFGVMSGDATLPLINTPQFTNGIQTLFPDGFQVGTVDAVNKAADLYYWVAFRNPPTMDLALTKAVDASNPDEGDTLTYAVTVANNGPLGASGIEVLDELPAGLTYLSYIPSQGSYDSGSGIWRLGALSAGTHASLELLARVNAETGGSTITNIAVITGSDQSDALPDNDADSADVLVKVPPTADLAVSQTVNDAIPNEGDTLTYSLAITNNGPDAATGILVRDLLPSGLTYTSSTTTRGIYDPGSGGWVVDALAVGQTVHASIRVTVNVDAAGTTISNTAFVFDVDQVDRISENNSATVQVAVQRPLLVTAFDQATASILPGASPREVLRFIVNNQSARAETLTALTLMNATLGPGSVPERDAEWSSLSLLLGSGTESGKILGTAKLSDGLTGFSGWVLPLASGEAATLIVRGGASLEARDGDVLDLRLSGPAALTFTRFVRLEAGGSLNPTGGFAVDGMAAAQIAVNTVPNKNFTAGSARGLALDVILPANGYEADLLQRMDVVNLGDAQPGSDIEMMEIWSDRGLPGFDPSQDLRLGMMEFTGQRWEITGLSEPVPRSGLRVFVSVDVNALTTRVGTIQLQIPSGISSGIGMASGNNGPLDRPVTDPETITISTLDKIVVAANPLPSGTVHPGDTDRAFAALVLTNTYAADKQLVSLTVSSLASGTGGTAELDGEFERLVLYADANRNGSFDGPPVDPAVATGVFLDRRARFGGLSVDFAPGESRHLFVRGDIALMGAPDGDELAVSLSGPLDVDFSTPTAVVGSWPVQSGGRWTVDGMVAAQVVVQGGSNATVGPGDGPLPALDMIVPPNGYKADVLNGLSVKNLGTALPNDIAELRLWADGGNGIADQGSGDDTNLGPLTWNGTRWQSLTMGVPITGSGLRLFVSMTLAGSFSDSATTVHLALSSQGLVVASGNDGPLDADVPSKSEFLLSTSPLLASLELSSTASTVGKPVTVRMVVENQSPESISNIIPSALQLIGDGSFNLVNGPLPSSVALAPASRDTFTWVYQAASPGSVRLSGEAAGTGDQSGLPRGSVPALSASHRVYIEAVELRLTPVESMPFSVNLGQAGVVPLSLTFTNPGGPGSSDVELTRLRIRVEDEAGQGIVPADLFSRVVLSEGQQIYQDKTVLETSGADIDLVLGAPFSPIVITSNEPTTLTLRFDIASAATAPKFRIAIVAESNMEARDRNSGAPVSFVLEQGGYPIRSGVATVMAPATSVEASAGPSSSEHAGPGQSSVPLLSFDLENIGTSGVTSSARVARFALALMDTLGNPISDPTRFLKQLEVRAGGETHAFQLVVPSDGDSIVLVLSPVTLVVNSPERIDVLGSIADAPQMGTFQAVLRGPVSFAVADVNTGRPVPVTFTSQPIAGGPITVEAQSHVLVVSGTPGFPAAITIGTQNVTAISAHLRHPGAPGTAGVLVDQLLIGCRDDRGQLVVPSLFLDGIRIRWNGVEAASVGSLPTSPAPVLVTLPNLLLEPGMTGQLDVIVDIDAGSPASHLQLTIQGSDIHAVDANVRTSVEIEPEPGQILPLVSGLTELETPPRMITVGLTSSMPATVAPDSQWIAAGRLTFQNPTAGGAGAIRMTSITIEAADREFAALDLGAVVNDLALLRNGVVVASRFGLSSDSTTARLTFPGGLVIDPAGSAILELHMRLKDAPSEAGIRLGVDASGIEVEQPSGALLLIEVRPAAGQNFPLWTNAASLSPASLDASYSNFPNPFAAGRENTTFAFYLPQPGRVTLRIWTPRGDEVLTLIDEERPAGMYQSDRWDGRNGKGVSVVNGVYVAELEVRFDGGESRRLLRKIGVRR